MTQPLLARKQVALALGLSLSTVGRLIRAGEIRHVRIGRSVRVTAAEVARVSTPSRVATASHRHRGT
ncbi:MAG: helix-turn-helix domain-containing protein [Gemmatimonadaceae bacterium]|nr:helix-turn-helix domain-containing protein [Gemmatimonadaceae bacterium]